MNETESDPLNNAIFESRRQLKELQNTLQQPNVDYEQILSQLSETSAKLKAESETIQNQKAIESSLLPLIPPQRPQNLIEQVRATSPKEYVPFRGNRAMELRKRYLKQAAPPKVLPHLKSINGNVSIMELIEKGQISPQDDLAGILPAISPSMNSGSNGIFTNMRIDIKGAAESFRIKRERKQQEIEKYEKENENNNPNTPLIAQAHPPTPESASIVSGGMSETTVEVHHPRIYEELQDEYAFQTLLVVRGKIARDTPDFESFKRTNEARWESIEQVLSAIEKFCVLFGIQFSEINGRKLSEAASLSILNDDDVYSCLVGVDEFIEKRRNDAANIIKYNWDVYLEKQEIKERKRLFMSAYMIQSFWRLQKKKIAFLIGLKQRIKLVDHKAEELSKTLSKSFLEIEKTDHIIVHVVANLQDIARCCDLMYSNNEIILILNALPPPHVWEDFLEFMSHNGIPNMNERLHFVVLKKLNTGSGITHKLMCDMYSVQQIRKIICKRDSYIIPHPDWHAERRLSSDIGIPILGIVDTIEFQSRSGIRSIFNESGVISTITTREHHNLSELLIEARDLMDMNRDITRWIIRLGFSATDDSIAWYDSSIEFFDSRIDIESAFKKALHCAKPINQFLSMIPNVGATIEAVPALVRSFPSVSLLICHNHIRTIGTYDRMHHSPFRFAGSIVPAISVEYDKLICLARQVGTTLLKKGALGYVTIDFMSYQEGNPEISIIGFDIRVNTYPSVLSTVYVGLCSGFDEKSGQVKLLKGVGPSKGSKSRYTVIHNAMSHPGFSQMGMKDLKKTMFSEGFIFDLYNRTGFRIVFYDSPSEGKGTAFTSATTPESAINSMEKTYSYLLRILAQKAGSDSNSSLAVTLIALRHFKTRIIQN